MFGIGMPEMILILAVALIVIGPKKLPDLAKSLGKAMGEFKKATSDLKDSMQMDTELKEVKSAFDDIGKAAPDASAEADAAVATETAAVDEAPADADDSMGQLKAAFDRHSGATEGPVEKAPKTEPEADSAARPETDRG